MTCKTRRSGEERVVLHASGINRHIQTIFSHSAAPALFVDANEGKSDVCSNKPWISQPFAAYRRSLFLLRLVGLVGYRVNGVYHAENSPNKKGPRFRKGRNIYIYIYSNILCQGIYIHTHTQRFPFSSAIMLPLIPSSLLQLKKKVLFPLKKAHSNERS